jgi:DNA-binding transcriptional LysR family regulator
MASIAVVDGTDVAALRLFLATVELGSVSKAAARLQMTQPSATAKLQKLERQLSTTLLERTPTGSAITPDGQRLAAACADVIAAATALVDRAEALGAERDRLTVAATRHVADHFLPGWVAGAQVIDAQLVLLELDTLRVAQAVRAGDAAIGFTEGPHPPLGLRSHVVATERLVPVVGRGHPWYGRRSAVTHPDLVGTTLVLGQPGSGSRDVVEAAFALHGRGGVGEHIPVPSVTAARLAALNGAGVAFLPRCRAHADLASGDLFALPLRELSIEQPVRVVWRGARPATRPARAFVDALTRRPVSDLG